MRAKEQVIMALSADVMVHFGYFDLEEQHVAEAGRSLKTSSTLGLQNQRP